MRRLAGALGSAASRDVALPGACLGPRRVRPVSAPFVISSQVFTAPGGDVLNCPADDSDDRP